MTELQKLMATKAIKNPAENNPAIIHKFSADPAVLVYNDTVYIYATNDAQQAEITKCKEDNAYNKITNLNIFSSKDLVNWTDCGEIAVAGKQNPKGAAKWANNSWAPAICTKKINGKDKFFLYFADNGSGIGVLTADSPTGPFTDPIGKQLVARSTPNCAKVYWLFDPAVFVDDDGTGYLYFGGGVDKDPAHPKSGRCVKLGDDMISLAGTPEEIDAPWLFEDSGINKIGNKYYYTYCSNWAERGDAKGPDVPPVAVIAYMTSDSPLGPFTYQGYTLQNPGTLFGAWGNNHHWIFQFKGKHYIAFHAQFVEKAMGNEKGGYRNICITDFKVNEDGSLPMQPATKSGVHPVEKFNPYQTIPAATFAATANAGVTSKQTLKAVTDTGYVCIKNADISKGAKEFVVTTAEGNKKGIVKIYKTSPAAVNLLGEIKTKGKGTFACKINLPAQADATADIYIQLNTQSELESWELK